MAYKKKITWYDKTPVLNQAIYDGLEFAFVSKSYSQICPFVLCKDYLQDAIFNQLHNTKKQIYGFKFVSCDGCEIQLSKIRLVIANAQDKTLRKKIPAMLDFLHQIESKLKIPKTKIRECASPPLKYIAGGAWLMEGNKRWLNSPPMISLYTMLIRVGFSHKRGDDFWDTINSICDGKKTAYQPEDRERLHFSRAGIKRILAEGDQKIFSKNIKENYPKGLKIKDMHDNLGICAFSSGTTKSLVPIWHKQITEEIQ